MTSSRLNMPMTPSWVAHGLASSLQRRQGHAPIKCSCHQALADGEAGNSPNCCMAGVHLGVREPCLGVHMERRKRVGDRPEAISGAFAVAGFKGRLSTPDFFVTACIVTIFRFLLRRPCFHYQNDLDHRPPPGSHGRPCFSRRLHPITPKPIMPISYCCCDCLLVMVLSPEQFTEIGGIDFHLHSFGHASRVVRVCLFMGFIFPNLQLRLSPVLNCLTVLAPSLLVKFIGPCGDLWCKIERLLSQQWGFSRVKNPIREQFHAVIHEEPCQRIAPNGQRPTPAEGCHKQPINRYQRRYDLRAEDGHP